MKRLVSEGDMRRVMKIIMGIEDVWPFKIILIYWLSQGK